MGNQDGIPVVAHGLAVHPDLREDRQVVEARHVASHRLEVEGVDR
jgi:hypothetical protein